MCNTQNVARSKTLISLSWLHLLVLGMVNSNQGIYITYWYIIIKNVYLQYDLEVKHDEINIIIIAVQVNCNMAWTKHGGTEKQQEGLN